MKTQMKAFLAAVMAGVAAFLLATPASAQSSAPLTICNKTSLALGTAIGYHSPGVSDPADHGVLTGPFVTRGWASIDPGTCHTFENPFNARYMFWFGFNAQYHNDLFGNDWQPRTTVAATKSPIAWCVPDIFKNAHGFTYELENVKVDDSTGATDNCLGGKQPKFMGVFQHGGYVGEPDGQFHGPVENHVERRT